MSLGLGLGGSSVSWAQTQAPIDDLAPPRRSIAPDTLEEVEIWDRYLHTVSALVGVFRNSTATGGSTSYAGLGVRYGYTVGRMLFARSNEFQDAVVLEGGIHVIQLSNFTPGASTGFTFEDRYRVYPVTFGVRYHLLFSESWGVFGQIGGVVNRAVRVDAGLGDETQRETNRANAISRLGRSRVALGAGVLVRVGPGWELRADLGIEMLAVGLSLRF